MDTTTLTTEERLSRISSQLDRITDVLALSNKSVSGIIIELQREIEDIYVSLEDEADTTESNEEV